MPQQSKTKINKRVHRGTIQMKQTLKINNIVHKVGKNNNPYQIYETEAGNFSCFKDEANKALEGTIGQIVTVDITERNGFKNIVSRLSDEDSAANVQVTSEKEGEPAPVQPEVTAKSEEKPYTLKVKQSSKGHHYWELSVKGDDLQTLANEVQALSEFANKHCDALNPAERPELETAE